MFDTAQANVTVMVSDFDAAFRFYTETLGLEVKQRVGNHWAEIAAPGVTIGLHPGLDADVPTTTAGVSIGFVVSDFDAVVSELQARGIAPEVTNTDRARSAYFKDPDGHTLYAMWRAG